MTAEGYRVLLAKNSREVVESVCHADPPDLVILDLDLPDAGDPAVLVEIRDCRPTLPVVVHTFLSEYKNHPAILSSGTFVEKDGTNIDGLKNVVLDLLHKCYPQRIRSAEAF